MFTKFVTALVFVVLAGGVCAATGDPQIKTEHPWYPGELTCSTFERLFKTQAELYKRVTGREVSSDEDKALAAWYWRNLNYMHADDGKCDYFGTGFQKTDYNREYWRGLFSFGFGLCFTTHAQWCGEMEKLLGHCRARAAMIPGHTSFEVFLTGGNYGAGKWVLLDHDCSTVVFNEEGSQLLSIKEIKEGKDKYSNPAFKTERQRGWRVSGLHDEDAKVYEDYKSVACEYGYYGPPPMVRLRSGESLRRYVRPGLDDGKTFAFWGMNYMSQNVPGPERPRTWVNQPEKMYQSKKGTGYIPGQGRFGNAVYTYKPNFADGSYKDGVISEDDKQVTFEFSSPYIIAGTPAKLMGENNKPLFWGNYDAGNTNGLVIGGKPGCAVKVSIDNGATWKAPETSAEKLDLTDLVKGSHAYWLRFETSASALAQSGLTITTVCQCNQTLVPHLKAGENTITYVAGGQAVVSAGPTIPLAAPCIVDGKLGTPGVTLKLATPRKEKAVHLYAAAHIASSSPPNDKILYQIEYSDDDGKTWKPVVKDWKILRQGYEPGDFWSQSFCYGDIALDGVTGPVQIRFSNSGKKNYVRVEAHLTYETGTEKPVDVTFAWKEGGAQKTASHTYTTAPGQEDATWKLTTGKDAQTDWVEYSVK